MTQAAFEESIKPYVINVYDNGAGTISEPTESILGIDLSTSQKDILDNYEDNMEEEPRNWLDVLMWVIKKLIEWIESLFEDEE